MATNKKSFVLYADYDELFCELSNEDAGELIKHIFGYVNDRNPETENPIVKVSFIPIKLQLKRDLKQWESEKKSRSEAGKKGMANRWGNKITDNTDNNVITNDNSVIPVITKITDNVTVNVTDTVNVIKKKFNYKNKLLALVPNEQLVDDFIELRKLKKASLSETAFNLLITECNKHKFDIAEALRISIEKNWQGFKVEWVKNLNTKNQPATNFQPVDHLKRKPF